jgi:hypothetical protein
LLREKACQTFDFSAETREFTANKTIQERLTQLLGTHVPQRLRNAVIGAVGCSGTGSSAIHLLARAEIGELVIVDPGQFKPSNHQRNHASRHADLAAKPAPTKVALASRLIQEISPATKVTGFVGDLLDEIVLDELVRCDLILGCTDSNYARAALGDIASHYLVPMRPHADGDQQRGTQNRQGYHHHPLERIRFHYRPIQPSFEQSQHSPMGWKCRESGSVSDIGFPFPAVQISGRRRIRSYIIFLSSHKFPRQSKTLSFSS